MAGRPRPAGDGPAVLISAAAAVERRFYRGFAQHLVDQGARAVLTYDYRGIGASAHDRGADAYRMQHWGTQDFPAALAALEGLPGSFSPLTWLALAVPVVAGALGGRAPVAAHEDVLAGDGRLHKEAEAKVLAHGERHQAHLRPRPALLICRIYTILRAF